MSAKRPILVFAEPFDDSAVARACEAGDAVLLTNPTGSELAAAVGSCDALLIRSSTKITRELLNPASRLKVIGRAGVGLENVDLDAARERGITVVYTPAASTDAVADLTIGLMLDALRRITSSDAAVRRGQFEGAREAALSRELSGLTLGVIGLGRIGRAVGRRCRHGFNMPVIYNDIVDPGWLDFAATPVEKSNLYRDADIVSLHVPLTPETKHLINGQTLGLFKKSAILINTARGAAVDTLALDAALREGQLAGAGLDVTDPEPLPPGHPLLSAPNVVFTPHVGARTHAAQQRMNEVIEDVIRVLQGTAPQFPAWTAPNDSATK